MTSTGINQGGANKCLPNDALIICHHQRIIASFIIIVTMNYRIASLLLATSMATATATATSSKAYRIFSDPPRPKTAKAFPSSSSVSEESFIPAKSSKLLSLSSALPIPSAKTVKSKVGKMMSKAVKCTKALDDDQSVSLSMPTLAKSGKTAKMAKCLPMSVSMSIDIVTAMPTYYPTYVPTAQPTTRRPTQRMVCQSGDFVDALGRDCFCKYCSYCYCCCCVFR